MNYPVVPGDLKIADAFGGVLGLPTTFVIGRDNRIHGKHSGATDFSALEREVVALLQRAEGLVPLPHYCLALQGGAGLSGLRLRIYKMLGFSP